MYHIETLYDVIIPEGVRAEEKHFALVGKVNGIWELIKTTNKFNCVIDEIFTWSSGERYCKIKTGGMVYVVAHDVDIKTGDLLIAGNKGRATKWYAPQNSYNLMSLFPMARSLQDKAENEIILVHLI
jgi:hypothetical protein